ncbi:UPF0687 protein C20orf27 homolog [Ctenocephalides felis]|uniref:UPF0687 protein C20orf27 homolog n=1 Tax=Ctenocephalides felis TaxID=7515 RepID=UPI000E6E2985|nr:UPF0687 protein C20orf27 homolog [Ctenocephalides felis]
MSAAASRSRNVEKQISFQKVGPKDILVHLGFLQIDHRYKITFCIPKSTLDIPNLIPDANKYFKAICEHIVEEVITLSNLDNFKDIRIILRATIIGKGKGTPMVRKGVKSVEVMEHSESDS